MKLRTNIIGAIIFKVCDKNILRNIQWLVYPEEEYHLDNGSSIGSAYSTRERDMGGRDLIRDVRGWDIGDVTWWDGTGGDGT
jgi:hypothetical protein